MEAVKGTTSGSKIVFQIELDPSEWAQECFEEGLSERGDYEGYSHRAPTFQDWIMQEVRKASLGHITQHQRKCIENDVQAAFDKALAPAIEKVIQDKFDAFLEEDVALTDRWGKKTFVGNIDDLIKRQVDEKLLKAVDSNGRTLHGCTSDGDTYLEWAVKSKLECYVKKMLDESDRELKKHVEKEVKTHVEAAKKEAAALAIAALDIKIK